MVLAVAILYVIHRHTPLVNAGDGELSFLIQVSLAVTLLSSMLFIGKSYHWSCMALQVALAWAFPFACLAVLERLFHCF